MASTEHTLVPTWRDHGFAMLLARFDVGSLAVLVARYRLAAQFGVMWQGRATARHKWDMHQHRWP